MCIAVADNNLIIILYCMNKTTFSKKYNAHKHIHTISIGMFVFYVQTKKLCECMWRDDHEPGLHGQSVTKKRRLTPQHDREPRKKCMHTRILKTTTSYSVAWYIWIIWRIKEREQRERVLFNSRACSTRCMTHTQANSPAHKTHAHTHMSKNKTKYTRELGCFFITNCGDAVRCWSRTRPHKHPHTNRHTDEYEVRRHF